MGAYKGRQNRIVWFSGSIKIEKCDYIFMTTIKGTSSGD